MFDLIYELKSELDELNDDVATPKCGQLYIGVADICGNITIGGTIGH